MDDKDAIRRYRNEAMRFWEWRRLIYMALLAIASLAGYLPGAIVSAGVGDQVNGTEVLLQFGVCFIAANACYTLVYAIEFFVMGTTAHGVFKHYRNWLLVAGCSFGALVAFGMARVIYWSQYSVF